MAKTEKPAEAGAMDLNLMRPTERQLARSPEGQIDEPVATRADREAYFGSMVAGFSGRAAHVLGKLPATGR